ncbi:MAG: VWA domain-containing protein [Myxococcaceae bacterium]
MRSSSNTFLPNSLLALFAAAALSACNCGGAAGAPCQSNMDCLNTLQCLDTQICATKCAGDMSCKADEKCSASGGCVPKSGCGSDRDCPTGQACTSNGTCAQSCSGMNSCGSTGVCLSSGTCATHCTTAADCMAGEKCSAAGGCISAMGCGTNSDCATGQLCNSVGKCVSDCRTAGCNPGAVCGTDGTCSPAAPDGGMNCGGELFQATKVNSNMLIAFDKSGSMADPITPGGAMSKWQIATSAVKQVTMQYDTQIQFGLELFPAGSGNGQKCVPAAVSVNVGPSTAAAIGTALDANMPGGSTPIGGVLTAAGMVTSLADPMRANYVMLVTDGTETCMGDGVTAATNNLAQKGIKTFVIGFGGEVDANNLNAIATAGGTPRPGTQKYYQADDAQGLLAAFNLIAQGALGCEYRLATAPPDPTKIFVYVNGVQQTHDTNHANGWDYASATQRITFYGGLCTLVANDATAKVSIVYGCADGSLIETDKRDGGAQLPNGSACLSNMDCVNGNCVGGICGLPVGSTCTNGNQCASSVCNAGVCDPGIN